LLPVRSSILALTMLATVPAAARPRVAELACEMGRHRTGVLVPRAAEDSSDDELACRLVVSGLAVPSLQPLAVEMRLLPPVGPFRVVASQPLERWDASPGQAGLDELLVPHSTWASAIDWRNRRAPRVRLEVRVYGKASPGWRLITSRRLDLVAWNGR
jgi:hypothetical protein